MSGILLYLGLLIIGGIFSYRGWIHKAMLARIDRLQMACLFGLLFIMGMRIGMDDRVKEAFFKIGLHAVLFGIFTVVFSVLTVHLMLRLYGRKQVTK